MTHILSITDKLLEFERRDNILCELKYYKNGKIDFKLAGKYAGEFKIEDTDQPAAYIEMLYIKPKHQNKGYGQLLLDLAIIIALHNKCTALSLYCAVDNEGGLRFYHRNGFFIALTRPNKGGVKHYLMVKKLN